MAGEFDKSKLTGERLPEQPLSLDDVVEACGFGWFQLRAFGVIFAQSVLHGFLLTSVTFVYEALKTEWPINDVAIGIQAGCIFLGFLIGALALGALADRFGRRVVFLGGELIIMAGGLLICLAPTFWVFCIGRVVTGVGVGGVAVTKNTLILEVTPSKDRAVLNLLISAVFPLGIMINAAVGWAMMPPDGRPGNEYAVWRLYLAISYLPLPAVALLALKYLPESPRFLLVKGKNEELLKLVRELAASNNCPDAVPECGLLASSEPQLDSSWSASCARLFKGRWFAITTGLWVVWFATAYIYYGFIYGLPKLFDDMHLNVYLLAILGSVVEFPGTLFCLVAVDRPELGRRMTLVLLMGFNALVCFVAGWYIPRAGFVTMVLLGRAAIGGAFGGVYLFTLELYPTSDRSFALGAGAAISRVGAMITPLSSLALSKWHWGLPVLDNTALMWSFTIISGAACLALIFVAVETCGEKLIDGDEQDQPDRAPDYQQVPSADQQAVESSATPKEHSKLDAGPA